MLYQFQPFNNFMSGHFIQTNSNFSDEEIDKIRLIGDTLSTTSVKLYGNHGQNDVKASGSHFLLNDNTKWIYDKIAHVIQSTNSMHYQYDLSGFTENFYYLSYTDTDHFNWHLDSGVETKNPRKLSAVLQLSDPSEYDGGDFNIMITDKHETLEKAKGLVTIFPSYKIHRVTPITRGVRRVLTMFVTGPNFR